MTPEILRHLSQRDKVLAKLIKRVGPCALVPKRRSPFEALVRSITYQQLNGTAAATILGRVKALYPHRRFPTPKDILATPVEKLRGAGLSCAKTAAILDLAKHALEGVVPTRRVLAKLTDAQIIERLTVVRGVGPWTVEMLLIFTLGREDVLPVSDYGVRKGFAQTYGLKELPTHKELLAHGERWRPHRSTAAWYMWRALEL
jgi:DNA-3-methyladenine glycosylase II